MQTLLILGARGYLAQAFARHWAARYRLIVSALDVTDRGDLDDLCERERPDLILNAAGVTHGRESQNIDGCEESAYAYARTWAGNVSGVDQVARVAHDARARLIHLSSGCIFNGPGPFGEASIPKPVSFYAHTKVAAEGVIQALCPSALILRLRMPLDGSTHPRNLLSKLARYAAVVDAPNSITAVDSLLEATDRLLAAHATGIVHVANPGIVSPYRIACQMADAEGRARPARLTPDALDALTAAPRSNCVLATPRLCAYGITLPSAQHMVTHAIAARVVEQVSVCR